MNVWISNWLKNKKDKIRMNLKKYANLITKGKKLDYNILQIILKKIEINKIKNEK